MQMTALTSIILKLCYTYLCLSRHKNFPFADHALIINGLIEQVNEDSKEVMKKSELKNETVQYS